MESNLSHETIKINKEIYNSTLEQSVELEYQLPDYYPGIFKMLQFRLEPHICSCRTSGDQIIIDGDTIMKLMYVDEENGLIRTINQNIPFSKTMKLKNESEETAIFYNIKTNYANCRIVSPRKIDVKGSLTISLKIQVQTDEMILSDASREGIELNRNSVSIISDQIWTTRQFGISEQVELDPPAQEILDVRINAVANECKIISNKAITKGEAYISVLYCSENSNVPIVKNVTTEISQIIDMPRIDEDFVCDVRYDVTSIDSNINENGSILDLEADVTVNGCAMLSKNIDLVTDAYSTECEIKTTTKEINSSSVKSLVNDTLVLNETIEKVRFSDIYDMCVNIFDLSPKQESDGFSFTAKLNIIALVNSDDDIAEVYEKTIPIEFKLKKDIKNENTTVDVDLTIMNISYQIVNGNLEIKIYAHIGGFIFCNEKFATVSDLILDNTKPKEKSNSALMLYYPEHGDSVWNIAKKFCTSTKAIMEANDLEDDMVINKVMLIIPIV